MDPVILKLFMIVLIFAVGFLSGLLPRFIGKTQRGNDLLMLGSALAGGVFLGAGLIHLLGDGLDLMGDFLGDIEFPWAFFIMGIGFMIILFIEKIVSRGDESDSSSAKHPFILLLILSVHSIIAGAALGLEPSAIASLILLIAILMHKGFAAFALGISFHDASFDKLKARNLIIFFSLMTPLGVAIGTALSSVLHSQAAVGAEAIFDSLAAGTFLYVATLDILKESFEGGERYAAKFISAALGFLLMAMLALWV